MYTHMHDDVQGYTFSSRERLRVLRVVLRSAMLVSYIVNMRSLSSRSLRSVLNWFSNVSSNL